MRTSYSLALLAMTGSLLAGCVSPAAAPDAAELAGRNVRECRYSESTGSNMRKRVCATREEWAAYDAAEQEEQTDDFFRQAREGGTAAGNVAQPDIGGF